MKRTIEIRAAEGGTDSKLFVKDLAQAYQKHFDRVGWLHRVLETRSGDVGSHIIEIEVEGEDLTQLDNESGGHRIQRVPPTEKKGRVHTSTVTVAVIDKCVTSQPEYSKQDKNDFTVEWFSGTGAGGQHRNKHQNSCRIIHVPTGLKQEAQCRSRQNSYQEAMSSMIERLDELSHNEQTGIISKDRKEKVGTGMRGDKIRTYRFQDNVVKDHKTNKVAPCDRIMRGYFELLW